MIAQMGKNHLGDSNRFLPTVHGFDEFYGNLYHLNAEEEPEQPDYPNDHPAFQNFFKPRGVLDCKASDVDDPTEEARFGRVGKQTITDSGPLTRKRMETIEDDLLARSVDFMERATAADNPFLSVAQHDPDACLDAPLRTGIRVRSDEHDAAHQREPGADAAGSARSDGPAAGEPEESDDEQRLGQAPGQRCRGRERSREREVEGSSGSVEMSRYTAAIIPPSSGPRRRPGRRPPGGADRWYARPSGWLAGRRSVQRDWWSWGSPSLSGCHRR